MSGGAGAMWTTETIGPSPRLSVDRAGEGELVLFLHGIGGNKRNWHDNLPAFARHYHAVAWDARGYGESEDYEGPLDFLDYARDVGRVLDHFGAARAHLVGLSMGGRIAGAFAVMHPERVKSLVLADTHLGFAHFTDEAKAEFVRLRKEPLEAGKEPRDIAEPVARTLVSPTGTAESFAKLVDSLCRLHKESYIKSVEASVNGDLDVLFDRTNHPTLVVVGADDRLTPVPLAERIHRMIEGSALHVIEGAGHLSNIEKPDAFDRVVLDFLRRVDAAA